MPRPDRDGSDRRHDLVRFLVSAELHSPPRGPERVSPVGHGTGSNRSLLVPPRPRACAGAAIAALFRSQSRSHWVERPAPLDTCVAPVPTLEEAMESEHFRARGMVLEYDHPVDGEIVEAAFALKISGIRLTVRPAPCTASTATRTCDRGHGLGRRDPIAPSGPARAVGIGRPASQGGFSGRP